MLMYGSIRQLNKNMKKKRYIVKMNLVKNFLISLILISLFSAMALGTAQESLKSAAEQEWERWDKGTRKESEPQMQPIVTEYNQAGGCGQNNPVVDPWSGAFISYVAKQAGITNFPANCLHTAYFSAIKNNPGICRTHPISEKDQIAVGDITCFCTTQCPIDYNNPTGRSHCDVVTKVLPDGKIETIGGNLGTNGQSTVGKMVRSLDASSWYGFISCDGDAPKQPSSSQSPPTQKDFLHIGDSHTAQNYGRELDRLLKEAGHTVSSYGCVSATANDYVNGGFKCIKGSTTQGTKQDYTLDSIDTLHARHIPDVVIVSLGGNYIKAPEQSKSLLEKVSKFPRCYWVGPAWGPYASTDASANTELFTKFSAEMEKIKGKCTYIDSLKLTDVNFCGDKRFCPGETRIHLDEYTRSSDTVNGINVAKQWAQAVFSIVTQEPGAPTLVPLGSTATSGRASTTSSPAQETCPNSQRCKEIDDVWNRISAFVSQLRKGKVWDTVKGWTPFEMAYPPVGVAVTSPPADTPKVVTSGPGTFAGLSFADTTYLPALVEEAKNQGVDPCYALATVKYESGGQALIVGNDVNAVLCSTISRRKFLLEKSPNCNSIYGGYSPAASGKLFSDCQQDRNLNSCITDFFDIKNYRLDVPTQGQAAKDYFCASPIKYDTGYTYGIGLGQGTPNIGSTTVNMGGVTYSHCDLFDPEKNIKGTVSHLKEKGAGIDQTPEKITLVFSTYVGGTANPQGPIRLASYQTCKNSQLSQQGFPSSMFSSSPPSTSVTLNPNVGETSSACTIPPENVGKTESDSADGCPKGMVRVNNFCIDRFEASLVKKGDINEPWSPYCNPSAQINNLKAVSLAGAIPQGFISADQAEVACKNAGKFLCTDTQWLKACAGNEGRRFPYGNEEIVGQCNYDKTHPDVKTAEDPNAQYSMHDPKVNKIYSLAASGVYGKCATPEGAYDLTGNLQEWVNDGSTGGKNKFGGGYYGAPLCSKGICIVQEPAEDNRGCGFQIVGHPTSYSDYSTGFRCCANPS